MAAAGILATTMKRLLLSPLAWLVVAACSSTSIDIADYDQTCSVDTECIAVPVGDPCACACDAGAVNGTAAQRYVADWKQAGTLCTEGVLCGACPALPIASCKAGRCAVE